MKERTIYLDMDEVISDLAGAILKLFSRDKSCMIPGEWMISKWLGILHDRLWEVIDNEGIDFWLNIEPYPWASELVEKLSLFSRVVIASTPSTTSIWSPSGKMGWLHDFFDDPRFTDYVLIRDKWRLSHGGALLIDDKPSNIEKFTRRPDGAPSGEAILFPAEWHENPISNPVDFVIEKVRKWEERMDESQE